MHSPPLILIVDDNATNRDIIASRLRVHGYQLAQAGDGEEALAAAESLSPDLILLDVMMPKVDGIEVCRRLKTTLDAPFVPIILITARSATEDVIAGLDAGADEYLTKPIDQGALVARVRSALRLKELHDRVSLQAAELAEWNKALEHRVSAQVAEIERISRLRRFLAPQVADLVLSSENEDLLGSHRREITVAFCDLRGFTAFSEVAEPEEVMRLLEEYHENLGSIVFKFEGTVERFMGDGLMVFFNDPIPCADHVLRAIHMANEMRDRMIEVVERWRMFGHELGFGMGVANGYATIGRVGYEGRFDYSAIGTVVNLAARLCAEAAHNQILVDAKVRAAVADSVSLEEVGPLRLRGFHKLVPVYNLKRL
jgi:class 3 adenylate cyclase/CheY-like chemotaxis protein